MESIRLKAYVGEDGLLQLTLPTGIINQNLDIMVILQPLPEEKVDAMGYPIGYFDSTYGSLADDPIERPEQLPLETRDAIE